MLNGISASLNGLQSASARLANSALRVANPGNNRDLPEKAQNTLTEEAQFSGDVDLARERVDQIVASYDYKANLKAFQAQDKMQKEVIDILA